MNVLNKNFVIELRNWGTGAIQYKDLPNPFGGMQRFAPFICNLCDIALRDPNSFEYTFLSRLDSLLFAKFSVRKYYVDSCFVPPKSELCVDSYYDGLSLPMHSQERAELLNKYNETFSDIISTDTNWIDFSDELIDEFD